MTDKNAKKIIVSGMRPTGFLHLGHYHGVIQNWVELQKNKEISSCYFFVADWHSLTTDYDNTDQIKKYTEEAVIDWLAYGLDPENAVIFVQSKVPEHAELQLLLGMITPVAWLERVPSYKDLQKELSNKDLSTFGFLGYPLLQTADVAIYQASHIPVGEDQVAHIELSREIIRRFNHIYKSDFLVEPQPLLTKLAKVPGTDGRKMSKSYNNSIFLSDSSEDTKKKVMPMMTDPARVKRTDPGDPAKCPVFDYHKIYSDAEAQAEITEGCTSAGIGCVDCKKRLLSNMDEALEPYRQRRMELADKRDLVQQVLEEGNAQAQRVARENMNRVREIMKV
ncbi:MAG: tryptophan--tRNA ligase [Deltaproteobacteria bacterium]|nr:tryptophan--tRNA ligase [Deltaproteobacteria bacterium]